MTSTMQSRRAFGSLVTARVVYAINWVNVGAIFYLMGPDLGAGVSGLGLITATFYLGLGLFQVPGGVLAARWGPKRVVVLGIFISSASALATASAAGVAEVAVLRFVVGCGMAFVFAPATIIVARLLRGEKSGMGVGVMNSTFDLGGIVGIFGWVVVASVTGWRPSLVLSGAFGLATGAMVALFVPGDRTAKTPKVDRKALAAVLADRQLVLLGLGTVGFGIAATVIAGFMTLYGVRSLGVSGALASGATSLVYVVPIFTSLWGGRAFDVLARHRMVMVASLIGSAAALALAAYPSLLAAAVCSSLAGLVSGVGYTFAFAGARELNRAGREYESLAVAWVNSLSLTGSFFPPIFFSYMVEAYGYRLAWVWSGVLTLAFVAPVLLMVETWRVRAA